MFRSDVVGSLLRPEFLKQAREKHELGEMSEEEFKRMEDRAVDEAIALQERAGLDVITDGRDAPVCFLWPPHRCRRRLR